MRKIVALAAAAVMLFALCAGASAATKVSIWHTFTDEQQAALTQSEQDLSSAQAALDHAFAKLGRDASVIVMPYGGSTLPHAENE